MKNEKNFFSQSVSWLPKKGKKTVHFKIAVYYIKGITGCSQEAKTQGKMQTVITDHALT